MTSLGPVTVAALLEELRLRLDASGVAASIHVVGGSAMAIRYPNDPDVRVTRDIDASFDPRREVLEIVALMATEHSLPADWLNSNAAPFIPPRESIVATDRTSVTIATVEELIAMKLAASRDRDLYDLGILARHAGVTEPGRLVEIAFDLYGEDSIPLNESRDDYLLLATQALDAARRRAKKA